MFLFIIFSNNLLKITISPFLWWLTKQTIFIFILVYFSAHYFSIVNSLRQLRHDAGGFSYKSIRTLRELFPLIIFGCKCCQIAHKKNIYQNDAVSNSKIWLTKRGIPSTNQTLQPPRKMKRWGMKKGYLSDILRMSIKLTFWRTIPPVIFSFAIIEWIAH